MRWSRLVFLLSPQPRPGGPGLEELTSRVGSGRVLWGHLMLLSVSTGVPSILGGVQWSPCPSPATLTPRSLTPDPQVCEPDQSVHRGSKCSFVSVFLMWLLLKISL